jgi:hypothetical protein
MASLPVKEMKTKLKKVVKFVPAKAKPILQRATRGITAAVQIQKMPWGCNASCSKSLCSNTSSIRVMSGTCSSNESRNMFQETKDK